jgi:hypothetical protein
VVVHGEPVGTADGGAGSGDTGHWRRRRGQRGAQDRGAHRGGSSGCVSHWRRRIDDECLWRPCSPGGKTQFPVSSKVPGCGGELREQEEVCLHHFDGFIAAGKGRGALSPELTMRRQWQQWKKLTLAQ